MGVLPFLSNLKLGSRRASFFRIKNAPDGARGEMKCLYVPLVDTFETINDSKKCFGVTFR